MRYRQSLTLIMIAAVAACGGGGAAVTAPSEAPPAVLSTLALTPASGTVAVGGTVQLTATPKDAIGNELAGGPTPTFATSDAARATVSPAGVVTGVAAGPVTITATLAWGGVTKTAAASLTVAAPAPPAAVFTTLALTPDAGSIAAGATLQLQAQPRDQTGAAMTGLAAASFASSAPGVATVGAGGLVTGVAAGTATITASLTSGGVTRTATSSITVTQPLPSAVTVTASRAGFTPAAVTLAVGGTVSWTMIDDDHDITFDGAGPEGGNVPRTDEGTIARRTFATAGTYAYHCARHGTERGTITVQAGQTGAPVFTSLTVTPSTGSVQTGATLQLTATARDQTGAAMSGLGAAAWSTSDAALATVSATGQVTGVAAGTVTVTPTLTAGGVTRTASATITVTPTAPPPPAGATVATQGVTFSPAVVTIAPGATVTWQIAGTTHNVTFGGAAPTGGNVPDTQAGGSATRTFPTAGTYDYQCTRHNGMTGRVVVQ